MMKHLKKFAAGLLAALLMVGTSACSGDTTWIIQRNDEKVPIGAYIYYLYNFYQNASTKVEDSSADILSQEIDGISAEEWIQQQALLSAKTLFVLDDKMEELGLTLTEEDQTNINTLSSSYWNTYGSVFESYGIAQESFTQAYAEYSVKYQKVFDAIYGPGGEKEVADADLQAYFKENYGDFSYFSVLLTKTEETDSSSSSSASSAANISSSTDSSSSSSSSSTPSTVAMTDEEKTAILEQLNGYVDQINAGDLTLKDADKAYQESQDKTYSDAVSDDTALIAEDSTAYPAAMLSTLRELENGKAAVVDLSSSYNMYIVVQKKDIADAVETQFGTENGRAQVLASMKSSEYSDWINSLAEELSVTVNEDAVKAYSPSMFKK